MFGLAVTLLKTP
ncbi:hypothetical protein E2C01_099456 [Portunus trituberculatus]|nr:hypothetical protein [Portunus trituberculatus]